MRRISIVGYSIHPAIISLVLKGFSDWNSVNVYYRINQEDHIGASSHEDGVIEVDPQRAKQVREFKIGSVGFSDGAGILLASLVAMPTEIELCKAQVGRGKMLCKSL